MTFDEWLDNINFVSEQIPVTELLAQFAEECSELAQAALKLRRAIDQTNPTPVTVDNARENVYEELADFYLCCDALEPYLKANEQPTYDKISDMQDEKLSRWVARLKEKCD